MANWKRYEREKKKLIEKKLTAAEYEKARRKLSRKCKI